MTTQTNKQLQSEVEIYQAMIMAVLYITRSSHRTQIKEKKEKKIFAKLCKILHFALS